MSVLRKCLKFSEDEVQDVENNFINYIIRSVKNILNVSVEEHHHCANTNKKLTKIYIPFFF